MDQSTSNTPQSTTSCLKAWPATTYLAQARREVSRLQRRIENATRRGEIGRRQSLQRILIISQAAKIVAAHRVIRNRGARTPGVDGELWVTCEQMQAGLSKIIVGTHQFRPLQRIKIPKPNGGSRSIDIPTIGDRVVQAVLLLALEPVVELQGDPSSYAYRRGRSLRQAVRGVRHVLSGDGAPRFALRGDIEACFERVDHEWLRSHLPLPRRYVEKLLDMSYAGRGKDKPIRRGIPQGSIISPALANLTLDGLEGLLASSFPEVDGVFYFRFADDLLITGRSEALLLSEVLPIVQRFLAERGLNLSRDKTRTFSAEAGFDFVGAHFQVRDGCVHVTPVARSVRRFLNGIRQRVQHAEGHAPIELVLQLNAVIRGWCASQQHITSPEALKYVDRRIAALLWGWAKRRHAGEARRWIKAKYFVDGLFTAESDLGRVSILVAAQWWGDRQKWH